MVSLLYKSVTHHLDFSDIHNDQNLIIPVDRSGALGLRLSVILAGGALVSNSVDKVLAELDSELGVAAVRVRYVGLVSPITIY
jgi:hypothetical protein